MYMYNVMYCRPNVDGGLTCHSLIGVGTGGGGGGGANRVRGRNLPSSLPV